MHLFALLALLVPILAGDVSVTTRDGEVVQGTLRMKSFKMKTDFGSAVIDGDKVASIVFGDPDVLVTTDDVELRGELSVSSLKIQTREGTKTLRRSELVSLSALEGGVPRRSTDYTGRWMTNMGPMKLEQKGLTVEGTYGFGDDSKIEGKVKGGLLEFEYRSTNGRGDGWFELWKDATGFGGEYESGNDKKKWGAYRLEPKRAVPTAGEITEGQSTSGLNYHLRVPKDFDGKQSYPALAFFHGSNMSSVSYIATIAATWPKLAEDYVLVGIDGERINATSTGSERTYNFTYVNFSGPEVGPVWMHNQSPALVAATLDELKESLPIAHWFIGGHSQGGFLTYAVAMFYPDKVAGAFPMSCNLLVQCEPDYSYYDDEKIRAAQRRVPIAHIHGENDPLVDFASGEYCYERMQDGGFPMLHFFTDANAGHMFAHLPVDEAVRWLEAWNTDDPAALLDFGEERLKAKEYRDATAAALRAAELDTGGKERLRIARVHEGVDAKAQKEAERLEGAIKKDADGAWVNDFWEFRRQFALTPGAEKCMAAYAKLREKHAEPAAKLFSAQRNAKGSDRDAKRREILEKYYASKWYKLVRRWLEED